MDREVAIQINGLKKKYKLGQIGGGTLTADLQSWWARVRRREDPNSIIGQEQRLVGQTFMALNGIDLTVYKGEALGIIGLNGAGKSTLLKILSKITAPTEGVIDIYGRITSMLEVGTGFHGEMTGRENVYLNGAILGMTKAEIDAKMDEIIAFSEVGEFIDTPVKRYSSGMYVKLAFSVAAHLDSEIMIMDEVLAVGDMAFQKKCLDKMRDAAIGNNRTVLYVSHNMNTIRQLCNRCIVLDKGRILFDGDVEKAIEIYFTSNRTGAQSELSYDYRQVERPKWLSRRQEVSLEALEICNKDNLIFVAGEKVTCKILLKAKVDAERIGVRFEFSSRAGGKCGTSLMAAQDLLEVRKGHEYSLYLSADISRMVPGDYDVTICVYYVDEFGNDDLIDVIEKTLAFTICEDVFSDYKWFTRGWGYVRFENLELLEQKELKTKKDVSM